MSLKTRPYDSANYLTDAESIAAYLEEVLDAGDPALISHAIDTVKRATFVAQ